MPDHILTIAFKNTKRDDVDYVEVIAPKKKKVKTTQTIQWLIKNFTANALTNVAVVDFFATNGGTPFAAGVPAAVNVPAKGAGGPGTGTINATAGDIDGYKYTIVANGFQVVDPDLDIESLE